MDINEPKAAELLVPDTNRILSLEDAKREPKQPTNIALKAEMRRMIDESENRIKGEVIKIAGNLRHAIVTSASNVGEATYEAIGERTQENLQNMERTILDEVYANRVAIDDTRALLGLPAYEWPAAPAVPDDEDEDFDDTSDGMYSPDAQEALDERSVEYAIAVMDGEGPHAGLMPRYNDTPPCGEPE